LAQPEISITVSGHTNQRSNTIWIVIIAIAFQRAGIRNIKTQSNVATLHKMDSLGNVTRQIVARIPSKRDRSNSGEN
jgi:hypothetical protein